MATAAAVDAPFHVCEHFYRVTPRLFGERARGRLVAKGVEHAFDSVRLLRRLRSLDPDVIHAQWFPLPIVDRITLVRLREIAPIAHTVHDSRPFHGERSSWVQSIGARAIRRRTDALIAHTEYTRERLARDGVHPESVSVIPHGLLHAGQFDDRPDPRRGDHQGAGSPGDRVLFFGSIKRYKGLDVLLRAFARLPVATRERTTLEIVGWPTQDPAPLRALAARLGVDCHIKWRLERVPTVEIGSLFGRATVVALPYRRIDQSGVLMTAIAAGVPVVATRVGGVPETIDDGTHGLLAPPERPGAFADALERVLADPAMLTRFAAETTTLARSWPSWGAIASETVEVYRTLE